MPATTRSHRLAHSTRTCSGLNRWSVTPTPIAARAGAWYQCGVQQLHLTTEKDASLVNKASRRHPAFRLADLEALRRRLETAGVEIIAGNRFPGQERFFVRDPWGNRLEFVERSTSPVGPVS